MKLPVLAFSLSLILSNISIASAEVKNIETDKAPRHDGATYSQGTSVDLSKGKLLFVSGQVATDPKTGKLREDDIRTATRQTLDNVEAILKAGGSDWKYVVRMDVFLKDLKEFDGMNEEYKKRFPNKIFPARQTVQVGMDYRVEISAIAFIPETTKLK